MSQTIKLEGIKVNEYEPAAVVFLVGNEVRMNCAECENQDWQPGFKRYRCSVTNRELGVNAQYTANAGFCPKVQQITTLINARQRSAA